jgi:hypothetical protein
MYSCLVAVDDVNKRRLQASTADKESIDIGLLGQLAAVLLRHTATVQDARLLRSLARDFLLEPLADGLVDLLCLLCGCDLAGANGPGRHVSKLCRYRA